MEEVNVHNVQFYGFHPEAIHCIAINNESKLLALSRAAGSIEIWNFYCKPFKQHTVIGIKGSSVESLVWCGNRLFSAGLNGFIVEFSEQTYQIKNQVSVTGGPTWCLALSPNNNLLAAGTEEGYVTIFEVVEDGLLYFKTLQKQKSRILSIGWHFDNDHLVNGSINYVHLTSISTEQTLQFPVSKIDSNQKTIVWCVAVLKDKTIVTGDSRGKTCFWEGTFGTLINSIQTHQADVLTLVVTPNSQSVYVAGVDPVIVEVRSVDGGGKQGKRNMWVKSVQRRIHTHDVRSMALTKEGKLFSGGVDTYLALSYYPPKTAIKFPATPPMGYISVAKKSLCVLLGCKDRVQLWKLGSGHSEDNGNNRYLSLDESAQKMVEIELKEGDSLEFCAVSPLSNWIAYSTSKGKLKVYNYTSLSTNEILLKKIICKDEKIIRSSQIMWLDEKKLLSATHTNCLQILSVDDDTLCLEKTLTLPTAGMTQLMASSADGLFVAILDTTKQVTIFFLGEKDCPTTVIPKMNVPITAFALDDKKIFISCCNMTFTEYDLRKSLCTPFGKELFNNNYSDISKSNNIIMNISFQPPDHIILHSVSSFYSINRKPPMCSAKPERQCKISKVESGAETESNDSNSPVKISCNGKLSTVGRANHVLYFSHMRENTLISIETNPILLHDSLPPALKVKKFGSS